MCSRSICATNSSSGRVIGGTTAGGGATSRALPPSERALPPPLLSDRLLRTLVVHRIFACVIWFRAIAIRFVACSTLRFRISFQLAWAARPHSDRR